MRGKKVKYIFLVLFALMLLNTVFFPSSIGENNIKNNVGKFFTVILNNPPVANDDFATTDEDNSVVVLVLDNDYDIDGDTITVDSVGDPSYGTAVINGGETITYSPESDYCGSDSFTYTITDGANNDAATVSIDIICVNDPPIANDDFITAIEDTIKTIYHNDLINNDLDLEEDTIEITSVGNPSHGITVNNGASRTITYSPDENYSGSDSFTYTISDGYGSDSATVTIDITSVNDAPCGGASDRLRIDKSNNVGTARFFINDVDSETVNYRINWGDGTQTSWLDGNIADHSFSETHEYLKIQKYYVIINIRDGDDDGLYGEDIHLPTNKGRSRFHNLEIDKSFYNFYFFDSSLSNMLFSKLINNMIK